MTSPAVALSEQEAGTIRGTLCAAMQVAIRKLEAKRFLLVCPFAQLSPKCSGTHQAELKLLGLGEAPPMANENGGSYAESYAKVVCLP